MTRVSALLDSLPQISRPAAAGWVAAALAEAEALRIHDDSLYPTSADPKELATAVHLHHGWSQWVEEAEQLLARLRPLQDSGEHIAGTTDLAYHIARARGILKITPQEMLRRQGQVEAGRVMSIEEVRRELRTANRG